MELPAVLQGSPRFLVVLALLFLPNDGGRASTVFERSAAAASPATGDRPYAPGPRSRRPRRVGRVDVRSTVRLDDVVARSIVVHAGGRLEATNVTVEGSVVVLPEVGAATTRVHLTDALVLGGMVVNVIDGAGNLYWGEPVDVDLVVSGSFVYERQGRPAAGDHTEALAGFGWPAGARFVRTAFVQQGPDNGTATAAVNWHGVDSVFDGCWFAWHGPVAASFTVYVEGRGNVVRNSSFARSGGYVYPDSNPQATYAANHDLASGRRIRVP